MILSLLLAQLKGVARWRNQAFIQSKIMFAEVFHLSGNAPEPWSLMA
ncbi:hypothetical protein N836_16130 [Leptolyngbya sp. Heron Island J]|nr:hypothetical protein N836_16130 [Leptolyngbya sp. Heron Island J]